MSRVYLALTIALLIGWTPWARGSTTFTSNTAVGNWSSASSWTPAGGPPTAANDAIIAAGNSIIIDTPGCVCKSLTIGNGSVGSAQITYNLGGILTVSGTVQVGSGSSDATLQLVPNPSQLICDQLTTGGTGTNTFVGGSGTLTISGNTTFTLPTAFTSYNNLSIAGGPGAVILGTNTSVSGTLNISSAGTLDVNGKTLNVTGATTIDGTLTHSGDGSFQAVTVNPTGTINFTSGSPKTITFTGAVVVNGAAGWGDSATALTVEFEAGLSGGSNFSANNSSNYIFKTASQSFTGTGVIHTLTLANSITLLNNGTLTVSSVTGTGTQVLQQGSGSTLTISGAVASATLDASTNSGNTVSYIGSGPQAVLAITYCNLDIGGITQLSTGTTTVGGTLTIAASSSLDTNNATIDVTGTTTINGTLTYTGGASGSTFSNTVTVNSSGTINVTGGASIAFLQALTVAGIWNDTSTPSVEFDNNLTVSVGGSFTGGASANYLFAINDQTFSGTATIPVLSVSSSKQLNNTGTLTVSFLDGSGVGTFLNNGTLNVDTISGGLMFHGTFIQGSAGVLNITGSTAITFGTFDASAAGNTVNYTGTGSQTIKLAQYSNLTISGARSGGCNITLDSTGTTSVSGNINITVTFATGGFATTGSTVNLNGSSAQTISGSTIMNFGSLQLSNPAGYVLAQDIAINATLIFGMGKITAGANTVFLQGASSAASGGNALSYVVGAMSKAFNVAAGQSFTFDVGDGTAYAPVAISNFNVTTGPGALIASSTAGNHPQIASSGIDPNRSAKRFWTLMPASVTGTFDATFNFVPGDLGAPADPTTFVAKVFNGSWSAATTGTLTLSSTKVTGLNATALGAVQLGNLAVTPVITGPSTFTGAQGVSLTIAIVAMNFPASYNATGLPAGLTINTTTGMITGTPTVTGTFPVSLSATNVAGTGNATLTLNIVPNAPPVPDSAGGAVITGEPVVGQQLTFNGVATDPNGLPLMFTWDFGDGTTASGATVQHVYNTPGTFAVNLTIADAALSTTVSIPLVIFAPGAVDVPNLATILNEGPLANPLNGITIQVTFSNGGIIGLTISLDALIRSAFDVTTSFDGIGGNVGTRTGLAPTIQFIKPGAFVATSTATDAGTNTVAGKGRKTIAVGNKELGLPVSYTKDPASPKIKTGKIGGKFTFSKSNAASAGASDTVTYSGSFELPEGLDLASKPTFSFAIGNIVDQTTVDLKGKGSAGTAGFIKKLQFKYPKLASGSTATKAGQMATFQVTIGGVNLSGKGFDTEGIAGTVLPSEKSLKSIPRSIQVAVVFAGVAYDTTANVSFKLATNGSSGNIGTRK